MTGVLDRPAAEEQGTEPAVPAVNSMRAKALYTVVSDALNVAAPASVNIPAISTVRIEATDGQFVTIATDRFVLGVSRVDYSGAAFSLTVNVDEKQVSFRFSTGEALTVTGVDVEFPRWRRLIPSTDERMAAAGVVGTGYKPGQPGQVRLGPPG